MKMDNVIAKPLCAADFRTAEHPRVFARADQRPALLEKIRTTPWAKKIYDDLKAQIDPMVTRHITDPAWIVSRLQMHWEAGRRFTEFYTTDGHGPVARREGDAPFPTVRLAHFGPGPTPLFPGKIPLERIIPYGDGSLWYEKDGQWNLYRFEQTGMLAEQVNQTILEYAYQAAIVFYFTGDTAYAKFAADIIWPVIRGASYQSQLDPLDHSNRFWNGFFSIETIGDTRRYTSIPLTYDFIFDYLQAEYFVSDDFVNGRPGEPWAPPQPGGKGWAMNRLAIMFQKYIQNKLDRGSGPRCNWNLIEHHSAMLYAFALEDDEACPDGKGRGYYVSRLLQGEATSGNGPYFTVIETVCDPQTGLWPEPPSSYSQGCIAYMVAFGCWYYQNGLDVMVQSQKVRKAVLAFPQVAFPNGLATASGDGGYAPMVQDTAEYMIAYARSHGDTEMENTFTVFLKGSGERRFTASDFGALFFYVPELVEATGAVTYPRVSYSPSHSLIFGRNLAPDPIDALAYSVYGFGKGYLHHSHRNGIAMELYGRGEVLGVDSGRASYGDAVHRDYLVHVAAHNAVAPNGQSGADESKMDLIINAAEPAVVAGEDPAFQLSSGYQFTDVSGVLVTPAGCADQRRVTGIVRTGPQSGYYVDIFRSRMQVGDDGWHDYLYHNRGVGLTVQDADGQPLPLKSGGLDTASGTGYAYFEDVRSLAYVDDFRAVFDLGRDDIQMTAWLMGTEQRTVFTLAGPSKPERLPTLLVRQQGEAWDRPFVAVYEPSGRGLEAGVQRVRRLQGLAAAADAVGIAVESTGGRIDRILNATSGLAHVAEGVAFQGVYGVVSTIAGDLESLYLGTGQRLSFGGFTLQSVDGQPLKAVLLKRDGDWVYMADHDVFISIPGRGMVHLPAAGQSSLVTQK